MGYNVYVTQYLNASLIALILETLACGIYTVLCGYTVWRFLLRKSKHTYTFILVLQWLLIVFTLTLDWRRTMIGAEQYGLVTAISWTLNSPDKSFDSSSWDWLNNVISTLVLLISDALLIWRCDTVCGGKPWILKVLGTLMLANIVGACVVLVPFGGTHALDFDIDGGCVLKATRFGRVIPRCRPYPLSYFIMCLLLSSILITGVSTYLIIVRISSATRTNTAIGNRAPYQKIQRIVIESGVIYLLGLLIAGVPLAVVQNLPLAQGPVAISMASVRTAVGGRQMYMMITCGQAFLQPLAGIVPTLIALRVTMQTPQTEVDGSQPVSRLTFRRTFRHSHTPTFGSLVSSLHLESTWEADMADENPCVADNEVVSNVQDPGPIEGEQIRLQKIRDMNNVF